jgi:hypothetical protein
MQVRLYAETAVVTGRIGSKVQDSLNVQLRFTDTFLKRKGHWQVVARHYSRIPAEQARIKRLSAAPSKLRNTLPPLATMCWEEQARSTLRSYPVREILSSTSASSSGRLTFGQCPLGSSIGATPSHSRAALRCHAGAIVRSSAQAT